MKVVRFKKDKFISYGFVEKDIVLEVSGSPYEDHYVTGREFSLKEIELLAPVEPSKVIAVGLNYKDHAKELKMPIPEEPVLFLKPPSSIIGPYKTIKLPEQSKRVDYEAELAFVVSKEAKDVPLEKAEDYIFGFTCANDVTARDLQEKDIQWSRAKSFDTFCPIGPWIKTSINPSTLGIKLYLDNDRKQSSNTSQMIFSTSRLLSFISTVMTLKPGDVILTGTPPGVGPLNSAKTVTVEIEALGKLENAISK